MRQRSTSPTKWALAFATARVLAEKNEFFEVPLCVGILKRETEVYHDILFATLPGWHHGVDHA